MNTSYLDVRHQIPCAALTPRGSRCGAKSKYVRDGHPCCGSHMLAASPQFAIWTDKPVGYWKGTVGIEVRKLV